MIRYILSIVILLLSIEAHAQIRSEEDLRSIESEIGSALYEEIITFRPRTGASEYLYSWFDIGRAVSIRTQALADIVRYHREWHRLSELKESEYQRFKELTASLNLLEEKISFYLMILPEDLGDIQTPDQIFSDSIPLTAQDGLFEQYLEELQKVYFERVPEFYEPQSFYRDLKLVTCVSLIRMLGEAIDKYQITDLELERILEDFRTGDSGFKDFEQRMKRKLNFEYQNVQVKDFVFHQIYETLNVIISVGQLSVPAFPVKDAKKRWGRTLVEPYLRSDADVAAEMVRSRINEVLIRTPKP